MTKVKRYQPPKQSRPENLDNDPVDRLHKLRRISGGGHKEDHDFIASLSVNDLLIVSVYYFEEMNPPIKLPSSDLRIALHDLMRRFNDINSGGLVKVRAMR